MRIWCVNSIFAAFRVAVPCSGSQWWVSSTGDNTAAGTRQAPYRTIQHAVDQSRPGDTVWVRAGRYEECVFIDAGKGGADGRWLTISAAPGDQRKVIVGYFDTIEEMHAVSDRYKGHTALNVDGSAQRP